MTMKIVFLSHFACMAGLLLPGAVMTVQADLSIQDQQYYAQRFRPYIKTDTSHDDYNDCELLPNVHPEDPTEPHHPCNWQWFIANCFLVSGYQSIQCDFGVLGSYGTADPKTEGRWPDGTILRYPSDLRFDPHELIRPPSADVRFGGAGMYDMGFALEWSTMDNWKGEEWPHVIHSGHGIYAHVEEVPRTLLINIEYTILWAYNSAAANMHNGDITTMTVVYDKGCDLLTRVTYSAHGAILQTYRTAQPQVNLWGLPGLDENGNNVCMRVAQLNISSDDAFTVLTGACAGSSAICSPNCSSSLPYLYFAYDTNTCRYEHPVVFAEYASHEFWPNPGGSACTAPAHNGKGVSFLPETVQVLGTLANPVAEHVPFLFYNGRMGTDPLGIIFHRTWFWPNGLLYLIADSRLSDVSPYQTLGKLPWPPAQEFTSGPQTVFVDWKNGTGNGTASSPFPDIVTGYSFVPSNGTIAVRNGTYAGPAVISRPCTIVSDGGAVTITGGAPSCLGPCVSYLHPLYVTGTYNNWINPGNQMTVLSGSSASTAIWQVSLTGLSDSGLQFFQVTDGNAAPHSNPTWCTPFGTPCWLDYAPNWFYPDSSGNITITYDPNAYSDGWYPAQGRISLSTDPGNWWLAYWTPGAHSPTTQPMNADGGGNYELDLVIPNPTNLFYYAEVGTNTPAVIGSYGICGNPGGINAPSITTTVPNQEVDFFVNAYAGLIKAVVKQ